MKSLFWRVLVWYLASVIVVLALSLAAIMVADPEFNFNRSVSVSREALNDLGLSYVRSWQKGGQPALRAALEKAPRARYVFDRAGRELSGRPVPYDVRRVMLRSQGSNGVEIEFVSPRALAGLTVTVNNEEFIFVTTLPRERRFSTFGTPLPAWIRVGLGLLTASVICVLFARYVITPIRRLRAATREFAAGNLQVRIGTAWPFNRKDEFTDLANDFDNMASKIQELVLAQHRMLGDISHELRSPLTRLQLALEIARRKSGGVAAEQLDRIEQEAERLNLLIGQILHATKTEQLHPKMKRLFDLANLVREVAADADFEASAYNRHVVVKSSQPSLVSGDRELVRSAIENVVRNAIRYTPVDSTVTVDLKKADASLVHVIVQDSGKGVPEEAIPHLFKPFYRVNDARDRDSGGAGLGLAITYHVVQAHGGRVRACNRSGGGFEVDLEFPLITVEKGSRGFRFR
jgi:two-component system sensor histidine kinase CpxA